MIFLGLGGYGWAAFLLSLCLLLGLFLVAKGSSELVGETSVQHTQSFQKVTVKGKVEGKRDRSLHSTQVLSCQKCHSPLEAVNSFGPGPASWALPSAGLPWCS